MASAPTPLDAAPAVPTSTDPEATFDGMFEAFLAWLKNQAQPGLNGLASVTYANALEAAAAATTATAQAQAAVAAVGAPVWAAGSYTLGQVVWSPGNGRTYRARTTHTGSTDPKDAPTNWWDVASFSVVTTVDVTTAVTLSLGVTSRLMTDGLSYPLPLAPNVGEWVAFRNRSGGTSINLDPGPTNKVEGATGLHAIDHPAAVGRLAWTGAADGWVYVP